MPSVRTMSSGSKELVIYKKIPELVSERKWKTRKYKWNDWKCNAVSPGLGFF